MSRKKKIRLRDMCLDQKLNYVAQQVDQTNQRIDRLGSPTKNSTLVHENARLQQELQRKQLVVKWLNQQVRELHDQQTRKPQGQPEGVRKSGETTRKLSRQQSAIDRIVGIHRTMGIKLREARGITEFEKLKNLVLDLGVLVEQLGQGIAAARGGTS